MTLGYDYIERKVAPGVVEFYTRTPQGHRVIRVYDDAKNPRIVAYNESNSTRTPATLFINELNELVARTKKICTQE